MLHQQESPRVVYRNSLIVVDILANLDHKKVLAAMAAQEVVPKLDNRPVKQFLRHDSDGDIDSDDSQVTANAVQEYTIPPEEGVTAYKLRKMVAGTLAPVYEIADDAGSTVISKVQEQYPELEVEPKQILDTVRGQLHDGCSAVVAMDEGQGADKGESMKEYLVTTLNPEDIRPETPYIIFVIT
ncbi:hypothetical protein Tco_1283759 [Tanacetum coccineum]